jgi:hypothetical protein
MKEMTEHSAVAGRDEGDSMEQEDENMDNEITNAAWKDCQKQPTKRKTRQTGRRTGHGRGKCRRQPLVNQVGSLPSRKRRWERKTPKSARNDLKI